VLFADVVGSTSLGESMDAEDLRQLLGRFYAIAVEIVEEHGGRFEKFIGDAAMAIFGLPRAHDDDASRALNAALDLRDRLRADPVLGDRLPIRMGINTGEVVASRDPDRSDFIITGDAVNVAARLQQTAEAWQIVASARTVSADLGAHRFGPQVQMEVKGKSEPVQAHVLAGRATGTAAPTAPLVGRRADMAQLALVAERTFTERRPYLVTLIAAAGTGKSRLAEEFIANLRTTAPDARVATAQCLPYGQRLTYWPMRALLLDIIGLDEEASAEVTHRAIRDWLADAGDDTVEDTAGLLATTIGAADVEISDRVVLFKAWRHGLEVAAEQQPLVLLIEDLHWSSDSLLDLLEFVMQPRADSPLLVMALARPELLERRPSWGGGRRNHISLALEPLDDDSIGKLVESLLEGAAPELSSIVISRSEGNPFFAGEIIRSLVERGVDLRDPDAVARAVGGLPDTVQATVLARLDALDPLARRTLQLGAVLGRSFSERGVVAIGHVDEDVAEAVEQLIERELVRASGRGELGFRHIIIRDVAYGTLPRSERTVLHAAAGQWLESLAAGREDEQAELIAFHYREAIAHGSSFGEVDPALRDAAVRWLRRAADVVGAARGIMEAAGHLRAAAELAPRLEQPAIYERLGDIHGSGDQAMQAYESAWRIGEEVGLPADLLLRCLGRQLMVMCRWFASVAQPVTEGDIRQLIDHGTRWLPEADDHARATFLIAAASLPFWLRQSGLRSLTDADFAEAAARVEEGLALAERLDDAVLISAALDAMTVDRTVTWPRAVKLSQRRLALGDRLPPLERLDALNMVAWGSAVLGDLGTVIQAAEMAVAQVEPGQNPGFSLAGASWGAYAHALRGDWEALVAAVEDLRQRWIDADRPAAGYALQGLLSGVGWASSRGDGKLGDRWRSVADDIIGRFPPGHPVAALSAATHLDLDGLKRIVIEHERYPDRAHYVEHALGLCGDYQHPIPLDVLERLLDRGRAEGMAVLSAQSHRLRGILTENPDDLSVALGTFERIGAARYAARVRVELGRAANDHDLRTRGQRELEALGEGDPPTSRGPLI